RVTEVEQPGKADHDVEAERQNREGERVGGGIDVAVIAVDQREGERSSGDRRDRDGPAGELSQARAPCGDRWLGRVDRGSGHALTTGSPRRGRESRPGGTPGREPGSRR